MIPTLIWWTTEEECRLIGEPHSLLDLQKMFVFPYYRHWGLCCIDDLPFPEYLKTLYCSRYGRPGNGRLWVPPNVADVSVDLTGNKYIETKLRRSAGLVFYAEDFSLVKKFPGLITDLKLTVKSTVLQ